MTVRVLWSRVTRGVPLVAVLLCVGVAVAVGVAAAAPGSVSQAWNQGALVSFLLLPVLTGLGAVEGQLSRRRGWADVVGVTPRGRLGWAVLSMVPLWLAGAVALAAAAVVSMLAYGGSPLGDLPDLLFPLYALLLCATGTSLGYTAGARTAHVVTTPVLAVAVLAGGYLVTFFRDSQDRAWLRWVEVYPLDFTYDEQTSANPDLWLPKSLLLALVLLALLAVLARRRRLALTAAAAALVLLGTVVLLTPFVEYSADVAAAGQPTPTPARAPVPVPSDVPTT